MGVSGWERVALMATAGVFFSGGLLAGPLLEQFLGSGSANTRSASSRSLRALERVLGEQLEGEHPLIPGIDLEYGPLRPLAQTAGQFKRELLTHYINTPEEDRWGDEAYATLAAAINKTVVLMGPHRRRSGRAFVSHGIGSGSCGLKAGLAPQYVAALVAHGTYIKSWEPAEEKPREDCEARKMVQEWLGEETEEALWKFTAMFATGPSNWSPVVWLEGLKQGVYDEVEKAIITMNICDDFEEAVDGELWWTMNWKSRPARFHDDMIKLAEMLGNEWLVNMAKQVYAETDQFFDGKRGDHRMVVGAIEQDVFLGGPSKEVMEGITMINKHCNPGTSVHGLGTGFTRTRWLTRILAEQKHDPYAFLASWDDHRQRVDEHCESHEHRLGGRLGDSAEEWPDEGGEGGAAAYQHVAQQERP